MKKKKNISSVAAERLCNTCGSCYGICPTQAIDYQETSGGYYLPVVDEKACTHCGLCFDVCPGVHFGDTLISQMPVDPFTGVVLDAFVGKATDKKVFDNSQSGGIVTALLSHSLETGRIKGAVIVSMESGSPPRPIVRIARSVSELYVAQKSKYCPVPLLGFFRELKEIDGPVAVVCTPCQLHGLHNVLDKMPKLQNKIAFTVGLVCDRVLTYAALDYLLSKARSDKSVPSILHFRDKAVSSYPGDVHVLSKNGRSVIMPAATRMRIKDYFTPARCRICFDKMNVFSDITVGDPHGLDGIDQRHGESMVLVRTEKGRKIFNYTKDKKVIDVRTIAYEQVFQGQGIDKKRQQWAGYVLAWKKQGRELPNYCDMVENHTPIPAEMKKYLQDLKSSFNQDNFLSRDELIIYVEASLKKKQLIKTLLFPARFSKRVISKLSFLISNYWNSSPSSTHGKR
ncbi:Coenzyme F420 hydrogenase/dehydrogenase, beta subunit C-terminal domain [Desulfogranum marinum]|uniref:Coenzyme F420 hydrogenase/dehydrogenase, beta subunit C-terminal domain n=1 Tax=Desulfogranum marinum TaxID=453220 RepID=UPI001963C73C|nr:Coenzyme F420 hydrogenase/dehydrogenase, beta subunit C-terminal domain [Desulfogranum marinum]MBM9513278.1 Coenzyme F420 hydrogenase/dehydrogenase, beta subunit C-terminal domain [Desulfogranum marinum]